MRIHEREQTAPTPVGMAACYAPHENPAIESWRYNCQLSDTASNLSLNPFRLPDNSASPVCWYTCSRTAARDLHQTGCRREANARSYSKTWLAKESADSTTDRLPDDVYVRLCDRYFERIAAAAALDTERKSDKSFCSTDRGVRTGIYKPSAYVLLFFFSVLNPCRQ